MRHLVFLSRFIVASVFAPITVYASSGVADAPAHGVSIEKREALKTLLNSPGNRGMEVRLSKRGVIEFVQRGDVPLKRATGPDDESRRMAALEFVAEHKALFGLRDADAEIRFQEELPDTTDRQHYVFRQHVNGVPVHAAEIRAHFDAEGDLYALSNNAVPAPTDLDTTPSLSADDVQYIVRDQFTSTALELATPVLEVRNIDGVYRLVYVIETMVDTVNRWKTLVDAHTGKVLQHYRDHHEGSVDAYGIDLAGKGQSFTAWERTGRFHLLDVTTPVLQGNEDPLVRVNEYGDTYVMDMLNSEGESSETVASRSASSGWDPAGVSAIANGQAAYRYFRDMHGRKGIDGRNSSLLFAIHYGENYDNAFWNGKWMVFGDGWRRFNNLAQCLDVVGHEMSHGVISTTANLVYENESGALNESFADVFGALMDGDDWLLAEDCTKIDPGFMRDMANPHRGVRWQPAHMSEYRDFPNTEEGDWGGVHVNSGIPNRAAYLLATGLTKEGLGVSIGRERTGKLYYRALTTYLMQLSEFVDLRRALLLSANDLYPGDAGVAAAIRAAFDAVGIVEGMDRTSDGALDTSTAGELSFSSARVDFGDVDNGATAERSLVITNNTDAEVFIHDIVAKGESFTHDFSTTMLRPGESLDGKVVFAGSTQAGSHASVLEVFTDSPHSPHAIDLLVTVSKEQAKTDNTPDAPKTASGGGAAGWWLLALLLPGVRRRRD